MKRSAFVATLGIAAFPHIASAQAQVIRLSDLPKDKRVALTLTTTPLPRDNCSISVDPAARPLASYIEQQKMQAIIDAEKSSTEADNYILYTVTIEGSGQVHTHPIETTMPPEQVARINARIDSALTGRGDTKSTSFRLRLDPSSPDEPVRVGRRVTCPPVILDQSKLERIVGELGRKFSRYARAVVIVWFQVDETGKAIKTEIRDSSTDPKFDEAAADIVKKNIHFKPALVDGTPIMVWVQIPIVLTNH